MAPICDLKTQFILIYVSEYFWGLVGGSQGIVGGGWAEAPPSGGVGDGGRDGEGPGLGLAGDEHLGPPLRKQRKVAPALLVICPWLLWSGWGSIPEPGPWDLGHSGHPTPLRGRRGSPSPPPRPRSTEAPLPLETPAAGPPWLCPLLALGVDFIPVSAAPGGSR